MSSLFVLCTALLLSVALGGVFFISLGAAAAARALCIGGFVLFTLSGTGLCFSTNTDPAGLVLVPLQPLLNPTQTADLLSEFGGALTAFIIAGGFLAGLPIRKILTDKVVSRNRAEARAELEAERKSISDECERAMAALRAKQKEAVLAHGQAKEMQKRAGRLGVELQARIDGLDEREEKIQQAGQELRKRISDYNAAVTEKNGIEEELRRQIEVLSQTNQKLKGAIGRLTPFKSAWQSALALKSAEEQAVMRRLLEEAKAQTRENAGKRRPGRGCVPSPRTIPEEQGGSGG